MADSILSEQSLSYLLGVASQALDNTLNEQLRKHEITSRQMQVLMCLSHLDEASQGELAGHLGIESATIVGVLDRMERDEWIQRHPCKDDRRKKIIRPTEKARSYWKSILDDSERVKDRATVGLTNAEVTTAMRVLARIQTNLRAEQEREEEAAATPAPRGRRAR